MPPRRSITNAADTARKWGENDIVPEDVFEHEIKDGSAGAMTPASHAATDHTGLPGVPPFVPPGAGVMMDRFTAVGGANETFNLSGNPTNANTIIVMVGFGALSYWATMGAVPYFTLSAPNQVRWSDALPPGPFLGGEPVAIMWW